MKNIFPYLVATLLAAFGLVTLFPSSSVIFDLFDIREKEGNYVLFNVWANFICSILYLFAAYGFVKNRRWTTHILIFATMILTIFFIGLLIYICFDGIYETKTIGVMVFRILLTFGFATYTYFTFKKKKI